MVGREDLAEVVPTFGLSVRWDELELRLADDGELLALADVAAGGVYDDPATPHRFAWTRGTPEQIRRNVLTHLWQVRGEIAPESWRLALTLFENGRAVGIQSIAAKGFATSRDAVTGSWLGAGFQGRGLGSRMRLMVLYLAFEHLGALSMRTRAYADNEASNVVSRKLGYALNGIQDVARDGDRVQDVLYRMTHEMWKRRPEALRPPINVTGAGPVRNLLGIEDTSEFAN